jgi:hypothetical protein
LHIYCRHVSPLVDNSGDFDRLERHQVACLVMKGEKRSFVVGQFDCLIVYTRVRSRNLPSVSHSHICCRHVSPLVYDSGSFDGLERH